MPGNPDDNPYIGTFLTLTTLGAGIPAMIVMLRDNRVFDCAVAFLLFFSSIMYHLSESWNTNSLFLTEMQWHRLDNIGVLSTIGATNVYIADFEDPRHAALVNWMLFFVILIFQEKDPWNTLFTAIPFVGVMSIPYVVHGYRYVSARSRNVHYHPRLYWKNIFLGLTSLLGLGGPCFILGLDDHNDPNRMWHFFWHMFGALASYYLNQSVIPRRKGNLRNTLDHEDERRGGSVPKNFI